MAKQAKIPITDVTCTSSLFVRYRVSPSGAWSTQDVNILGTDIYIMGLADSTTYDYEITRTCCNGQLSGTTSGSFTTS